MLKLLFEQIDTSNEILLRDTSAGRGRLVIRK